MNQPRLVSVITDTVHAVLSVLNQRSVYKPY
jgi:hypothetical protein